MGKIFCIMGKSGSGKDTVYNLLKQSGLEVSSIVPYTTRPMRVGEAEGEQYHFITVEQLEELRREGLVIEERCYHTVHGDWYYATIRDGSVDPENRDYLIIGTLESYMGMKRYFGDEIMVPLYIEVEDGLRLVRALERERSQDQPKYKELCRRFLADGEDFSEEKLLEAGIEKRFVNIELQDTVEAIAAYIRSMQR